MNKSESNSKDCLSCKIVGSGGLFFISVYIYNIARSHTKFGNKLTLYSLGSGIIY